MKTIYTSLLTCMLALGGNAQLTLLPAYHEPAAGDMDGKKQYDSTAAIAAGTGTAMLWDFSSFVMKTTPAITQTFVAASAVPSASMFTGATLAGTRNNTEYTFYKSSTTPSQFEMLGTYDGTTATTQFTNSMVWYAWPISYASMYSDNYVGTSTGETITGTVNVHASGSGSMIIPGGSQYSNVLQVKSTDVRVTTNTLTTLSTTMTTTRYDYFHGSTKFPIVSIVYDNNSVTQTATIWVNYLVAVGIQERVTNSGFSIFPNPASDHFNIKLQNADRQPCSVEVYSALGQLIKTVDLGDQVSIDRNIGIKELHTGLYIIRTTTGDKVSTKRLVVE